jgi:hypothetical protein
MTDIPKELAEKLKHMSEDDIKTFIALVQTRKKQDEIHELEYEFMKQQSSLREIPFKSSTPEGEMVANLDDGNYVDMNTRLSDTEISAALRFDVLQKMGIMPKDIPLTNIYKRLKISQKGQGRAEKVSIVTGAKAKREGPTNIMETLFKKRNVIEDAGKPGTE